MFDPYEEWQDMPEYVSANRKAIHRMTMNFETEEDMAAFSKLIGKNITLNTKGVFFPVVDKTLMVYIDEP